MQNKKADRARQIAGFALLLGFTIMILSCKQQPKEPGVFKGVREPVTLGVAQMIISAPVIIANEKGFFAEEGLDVTMKEYAFGKLAIDAMFADQVNLATVAEAPIVMNGFKRDDFLVVATFAQNSDDMKLIVRTGKGMRTGADLKGRKIGTAFGTALQYYLDLQLIHHGLLHADIEAVNLAPNELSNALAIGKVDAITLYEPLAYETLRSLQDKVMRLPKADIYRLTFHLATMRNYANEHPEAIKRVLRAVDKAMTFIKQNRRESMEIIARTLRVDDKLLEAVWADYQFNLSLDQAMLISLEEEARWAIRHKLTDKKTVPNYLNLILVEGLSAVKPEAVTIIR